MKESYEMEDLLGFIAGGVMFVVVSAIVYLDLWNIEDDDDDVDLHVHIQDDGQRQTTHDKR